MKKLIENIKKGEEFMVIDQDTILYFSGTGNSLQVAKDINRELRDFKLCNISSIITEEVLNVSNGNDFIIGRSLDTGLESGRFAPKASFDDVRIYKGVLTDKEIQYMYTAKNK
jgi:menaquinone-dependent protoporphyrinogen IX oxidase